MRLSVSILDGRISDAEIVILGKHPQSCRMSVRFQVLCHKPALSAFIFIIKLLNINLLAFVKPFSFLHFIADFTQPQFNHIQ